MIKIGLWILMTVIAPHFLNASQTCSLCNQTVIKNQKFYEDENVVILYDYRPIIEGHCLIMPKRHVQKLHDMSSEELISTQKAISKLFDASKEAYNASAYLILQKNGKEAGQSVPHVHFHFFPRREGDYTDIGLLARFYIASFKGPISQKEIDFQRNLLSEKMDISKNENFSGLQNVS